MYRGELRAEVDECFGTSLVGCEIFRGFVRFLGKFSLRPLRLCGELTFEQVTAETQMTQGSLRGRCQYAFNVCVESPGDTQRLLIFIMRKQASHSIVRNMYSIGSFVDEDRYRRI